MYEQASKPTENKSKKAYNVVSQKRRNGESTFEFLDNRPEVVAQRRLQTKIYKSRQTQHTAQLQRAVSKKFLQKNGSDNSSKSIIQKVSGLEIGRYVQVADGRLKWYGQIHKVLDRKYSIRVGGTTDTFSEVSEERVTLHPTIIEMRNNKAVKDEISKLQYEYLLFASVEDMNNKNVTRKDIKNEKEQLLYDKISSYLKQFGGTLTLHDGAKKTIIASGANQVLKIYPPGVFEKEKAYYSKLESRGADMRNFVSQWAWDESTHTARAELLISTSPPGDRIEAMRVILGNLRSVGLFLNDLNRNDNIGTNAGGRAVVFDVKSLVEYSQRAYEIP